MQGIDVRIYTVQNGYIIEDNIDGSTYVAGKLDSYSMLDSTVVSVLRQMEYKLREAEQASPNNVDAADIV